ncbi:MAG: hypothetical protein J0I47_07325 [Sphingomonas sp.]|uniref:hypothetical protein n=1 Tax=Sphingomonas sp. TaxID=28214 RepID=UPI001AC8446F|nr:hypothetical protein [Sphingomonas sp.]MBN8808034.1 hypothetical protein [Sphingomonas sp.]
MKRIVLVLALAALSGCGAARDLQPVAGRALPPAPYGATATPTPTQLLTASSQARPQRSDDVLTSSEVRQGNEFDLPPSR